MIEKIIMDYINRDLDTPCYMEEPEKPPASYLLIDKTGTSEQDYISSATIAIQSYGANLYATAQLNHKVKQIMADIIELPQICRCKLNSDYNFTDTDTKRYRYQAIFDITFYDD